MKSSVSVSLFNSIHLQYLHTYGFSLNTAILFMHKSKMFVRIFLKKQNVRLCGSKYKLVRYPTTILLSFIKIDLPKDMPTPSP